MRYFFIIVVEKVMYFRPPGHSKPYCLESMPLYPGGFGNTLHTNGQFNRHNQTAVVNEKMARPVAKLSNHLTSGMQEGFSALNPS